MLHKRPGGGIAQGYYCLSCGDSGMNMFGMPHLSFDENDKAIYTCQRDPELVEEIGEVNRGPSNSQSPA